MKIAHITNHNQFDPDSYSGTPFWISKSLKAADVDLEPLYIPVPLKFLPPLEEFWFRCQQAWHKFYHRAYLDADYCKRRARFLADALKAPLQHMRLDAILTSHTPTAAAFLETQTPIVYWTDAVYCALAAFYPKFRSYHPDTHWDGHTVTQACLNNCRLLIFSSRWAARTAIEYYGVIKEKVHVVPFGANLKITHNFLDVEAFIKSRSKTKIKLLFVGKEWHRKGGDIVLRVANKLIADGYPVELTILGWVNPKINLPEYVITQGYILKKDPQGIEKIQAAYREAHFLFVPSRADCCPIVYAEANAFGVPCITTYVGGIPDAIKDDINGRTFSLEATVEDYCSYIIKLWENNNLYK
jgi:glycosyltransferase involved in cell wall biosynthesis